MKDKFNNIVRVRSGNFFVNQYSVIAFWNGTKHSVLFLTGENHTGCKFCINYSEIEIVVDISTFFNSKSHFRGFCSQFIKKGFDYFNDIYKDNPNVL